MKKMLFMLCALMSFAFGQPFQDGVTAYRNKDYDKAIVNFTEAIRLSPNDVSSYYNRGISYIAKGDDARAIPDLETALRLNPSHGNAKSSLEAARRRQSQAKAAGSSPAASVAKTAAIDELDISIRDASDYLNEKIPKGSKIVILNIQSNSSDLSDYIIDELIANAVNDGFFTVVDRQQLDAIRSEQNFQLSGAVDDKDALAIGKLFGAKTIVSGAVNRLGATGYRVRIRALEVQTAQVQGQFNRNIASSKTINSLMESGGTASGGYAIGGYGAGTATTSVAQVAAPLSKPGATQTIQGTMVPGGSLTEKLAWLQRSADSHNTYIVEVNTDEKIAPHTFEYTGAINITIVLRGVGANRTIRLRSHGTMFTVRPNVTFILDNNITLQGHNGNTASLVYVNGGTIKMNNGSTITGNHNNSSGGGVLVANNGIFDMNGGTISSNVGGVGGGVYVYTKGTFTMRGGTISGNTAQWGGGVDGSEGTFTMLGGTIIGNIAYNGGGGVSMGTNHTSTMSGGIITGNTARELCGGVCIGPHAKFTKTSGTITGYSSDQKNGNVVRDEGGNILARRGHTGLVIDGVRKETTAGSGDNLSYDGSKWRDKSSGAWDQ